MDYVDAFYNALINILPFTTQGQQAFFFMLVGIFIGFWVGILPGLGGAATLALMLPFIYKMDPTSAFAFLLGSNAVIVFDNVAFGLKMKSRPRDEIEKRVAEVLDLVNMPGFAHRRVTDLSGGEQQRVALARALTPRPRLLMLDEPLGALDRTLKEDLLDELRTILHRTRIPAIYVTHDQEEAFAIADRVLLLHEGRIVRQGHPAEVWAQI